jgi:hypothetical protein
MNPRSIRKKVATGVVNGIGGEDKFHFTIIPETWLKIDITKVFAPNVALMLEVALVDQRGVGDVKGGNAIWDQKFLKVVVA